MLEIIEIMDEHLFGDPPDFRYRGTRIDRLDLRKLIEEVYYSQNPEQTWDSYFKR